MLGDSVRGRGMARFLASFALNNLRPAGPNRPLPTVPNGSNGTQQCPQCKSTRNKTENERDQTVNQAKRVTAWSGRRGECHPSRRGPSNVTARQWQVGNLPHGTYSSANPNGSGFPRGALRRRRPGRQKVLHSVVYGYMSRRLPRARAGLAGRRRRFLCPRGQRSHCRKRSTAASTSLRRFSKTANSPMIAAPRMMQQVQKIQICRCSKAA